MQDSDARTLLLRVIRIAEILQSTQRTPGGWRTREHCELEAIIIELELIALKDELSKR